MQLFSLDDPATRIGEAIGSILATAIYLGIIGVSIHSFIYH